MNAKTLVSLAVAIALGVAATWVGRNIVLGNRTIGISTPTISEVVVAKGDLQPGQLIEAGDVMLAEMPTSSVSKGMFRDTKSLVGRAVVSPVVKGQAMFEGLLAPPGSEGGLPALVPDGKRAVSVEVTESSSVGGLLTPGCRVDVIATLRPDDHGQMARTIVENVKVQAVNRRLGKEDPSGDTPVMKTVTLIVMPKDAEAIELASNAGRLRLVLRGATDTVRTASPGVTFAELTGAVTPSDAGASANGQTSVLDRLLAAMLDASKNRVTQVEEPQITRQAVRIIRGSNESTIYYEMRPRNGANGGDDGWAVTYPAAERPANGQQQQSQDPFSGNK